MYSGFPNRARRYFAKRTKVLKKKDFIIIGVVLAIAVVLLAVKYLPVSKGSSDYIVIYVGNEEYKRVPIGDKQMITIDQGNGKVNVVEITERGAVMHSSTCANQDCIHEGEVTLDNYNNRVLNNWIICLPNKVSVELVTEGME